MTPQIKQRIEQIRRGEVPEGYKRTKAGVVPIKWDMQQIKDFARISSGSTPSRNNSTYWNGNIPWVTTGELECGYIEKTRENITGRALSETSLKIFPRGTLLMAMYGQGKTRGTVAKLGIEATVNQACAAISPTSGDTDFIFYILQNAYDEIRKLSNTGNQDNLNADIIKTFSVIFPPISEQKKIAKILDAQDKLIALKEKIIDEKEQQKKALVQRLLSGKMRLPGFNGEWNIVRLNEVLLERKEKNVNQDHRIASVAVQQGVIDQIEHLGRSYAAADTSNYGIAHYGDIIYTKSPTGDFPYGIIKQSHMKESVALSPLYGIYKPISFELGYILHTFLGYPINCSNYLFPIIQKGAKNTINITNDVFVSNRLYLPIDTEEQKALAKLFITADEEINLLTQELVQEKKKKKSLMQLLLTGIVRV